MGQAYGINLQEWNYDQDHVHVLFRATPHTEMAKFLNAYKSSSSRMVKKQFPEIKQYLWKSAFWTQSYCLISKELSESSHYGGEVSAKDCQPTVGSATKIHY
nr:IS200/IS605 family transposase [Limosilactobacillus reuteri]